MTKRRLALAIVLLGFAACAGVLGLRKREPTSFPHRKHLLNGVACTRCHTGIDQANTNDGVLHLPDAASCVMLDGTVVWFTSRSSRRSAGMVRGPAQNLRSRRTRRRRGVIRAHR